MGMGREKFSTFGAEDSGRILHCIALPCIAWVGEFDRISREQELYRYVSRYLDI